MEAKYRKWHRIQGISVIVYAVSMFLLWWMIYAESPYALMIILAAVATVSLVLSTVSGVIRGFIGYKMGLKATKKDWLILGIAIVLAVLV